MSYQVLARKWRPRSFSEMVGQEHVLKALINALDHKRLHHAYLFTGTRGVGKTTVARILAKCLNCETGVGSSPCGVCNTCVEINEGRFVDLIEVDAASRTKVEDTRELLDNVQYSPTSGRYKIYLIDEVHMLSNSSFNALLKTLEEPPEHVKFLLATTDPQKLPATILSRCLQFNLKNMSPEKIVEHLQTVLSEEMVPFEETALWQLARAADGSMRDALSLTDQAIAFGNGKLGESDVTSMLGTIDHKFIQHIIEALISLDGGLLLKAVAQFSEHGPDYAAALADLQTFLHRIAIAQALPEALDNSYGDRQQILRFATQLTPEDVQLFYQTALIGQRDLSLSSVPRTGFEMILLRMLAFRPQGLVDVPKNVLPAKEAPVVTEEEHSDLQTNPGINTEPVAQQPESTEAASSNGVNNQANLSQADVSKEEAPPWEEQTTSQPVQEAEPSVKKSEDPHADSRELLADQASVESAHEASTAETYNVDAVPEQNEGRTEQVHSEVAEQASESPPTHVPRDENIAATAPLNTVDGNSVLGSSEHLAEPQSTPTTKERLLAEIANISAKSERTNHVETKETKKQPIGERALVEEAAEKYALSDVTPAHWLRLFFRLPITGVAKMTASNLVCVGRQDNQFYFMQDEQAGGFLNTEHAQYLGDALSDYFGAPCKADIGVGTLPVDSETPAQYRERRKQERLTSAIEDLRADPAIIFLQDQFGGQLEEQSVKVEEEQL